VAVSTKTAVFHIGSRSKEELSHLVQEAFMGWLVSDGYAAYRSHSKRQRCLAHLIRKAIALTGAINQKAAQIGQWILDDLRELIAAIAEASEDNRLVRKLLARLRRVCHNGKKANHQKLQALAKEILNDWDAVVAKLKNPELPPTNNEAERALRRETRSASQCLRQRILYLLELCLNLCQLKFPLPQMLLVFCQLSLVVRSQRSLLKWHWDSDSSYNVNSVIKSCQNLCPKLLVPDSPIAPQNDSNGLPAD
jgi:hypothetical protein